MQHPDRAVQARSRSRRSAVGVYLPLASLTPIFLGGCVRRLADARQGDGAGESDPGILAASGLIAGEGLAGVAIAFLVAARGSWPEAWWSTLLGRWHFAERGFSHLTGAAAVAGGSLIVFAVCAMLYRAGARRVRSEA